ncbi:Spy/CpxP family protein refolding chaperone [Alteromonas sp. CYL-A6]|uniref:Spy/CpxP family protein refolding chaperone n=1 Tax=Alteromonas nitratireducens TaxID=3390813 RepID=UPI0034A6C0A1
MTSHLIRTLVLASVLTAGSAIAHPGNESPRPAGGIIKTMQSLSLTDQQRAEVKSLMKAWRADRTDQPPRGNAARLFALAEQDEKTLRSTVTEQVDARLQHALARAELHHALYALLDSEQQATLISKLNQHQPERLPPQARMHRLLNKLDLTPEQRETVSPLLEDAESLFTAQHQLMRSIRSAQQGIVFSDRFSESAWQAALEPYRAGLLDNAIAGALTMQQVFAVLDDAQKQTLSDMLERRREHASARRHG